MESYKIGEEVAFKEPVDIETALGGVKLTIRKGDRAVIVRPGKEGYVVATVKNGPAAGKMILIEGTIKGVAYRTIAEGVTKKALYHVGITDGDVDSDELEYAVDAVQEILEEYF